MDQVEWMEEYRRRLARRRVPISVTFELTRRCNLRCIHCYLGSQEAQQEAASGEMSTDHVKGIIDEIVAAGCLYLLLTGGDPMMRRDFGEIYRYAREQGLIVTVFCDGMLVDDAVIELFREFPPHMVEISIYGASEATYEKVTRVKGSFKRSLDGIRRLLDAGIQVGLKTILMTVNVHEIEAMREMADAMDVMFRMDAAIFPCMPTNDHGPLDLRVDPALAAAKELSDNEAERSWRKYMAERENLPPSESLFVCGAGVTGFSIDPFGYASPCLMMGHERYNLLERGVDAIWNEELSRLQDRVARPEYACSSCEMRAACTVCPAFNYLETGHEDVRSDYVCATTVARWQHLTGKNSGGLPVVTTAAVDGD
jgi:radical SAM protein with 4Fe4S-binding SPASM domain